MAAIGTPPRRRGGLGGRTRLRWMLVPLLAGGLALASVELAAACSCAVGRGGSDTTRESLQHADAAVIGVVTARRAPPVDDPADFGLGDVELDIRVERAFKAPLGEQITVHTASSGATCGLGAQPGDRVSLLLSGSAARYSSGSCSTVDPQRLAQAAEPLPRPRGRGPVRFLLAGGFGAPSVIALDAQGSPLAYGAGPGALTHMDVCPGGRYSLETTTFEGLRQLHVRNLRTMRLTRRVQLAGDALAASCRTPDARGIVVLVSQAARGGTPTSRLLALSARATRVLHRGSADGGSVGGRYAWLPSGAGPPRLTRVDIATGRVLHVARRAAANSVVASPGGALAAFQDGNGRLCVAARAGAVSTGPGPLALVTWIDDGSLVARVSGARLNPVRVLDHRLRPLRALRGFDDVYAATAAHGRLYAIADDRLVSVRPRGGPLVRLSRVPSGATTLVTVGGATRVTARARAAAG